MSTAKLLDRIERLHLQWGDKRQITSRPKAKDNSDAKSDISWYATTMIHRHKYLERLSKAVKRSPVTALLGPRQCGKTTLAKEFTKDKPAHLFDFESPQDRSRLQNAMLPMHKKVTALPFHEYERIR